MQFKEARAQILSMGKREKPQPVSWKSQLSPPSSHLSIVIAYFFYRCTAVRTSSNSSVSPEIAILLVSVLGAMCYVF